MPEVFVEDVRFAIRGTPSIDLDSRYSSPRHKFSCNPSSRSVFCGSCQNLGLGFRIWFQGEEVSSDKNRRNKLAVVLKHICFTHRHTFALAGRQEGEHTQLHEEMQQQHAMTVNNSSQTLHLRASQCGRTARLPRNRHLLRMPNHDAA